MKQKRIIIIGDSHTDAIKKALKKYQQASFTISAYRLQRIKNEQQIGDISIEGCLQLISELEQGDLIFSTIGGNQHQIFSLIQHPVAFELFEPNSKKIDKSDNVTYIPYDVLWDVFENGLRVKDEDKLLKIRSTAKCSVFHLAPPPPKKDTSHILQHYESAFVKKGLMEKGISPASLRLKIWRLQLRVLTYLCTEWNIQFVPVPDNCLTEEGFLKKDYYANDATHGNILYGELVLNQIESIAHGSQINTEVL